MAQYGPTVDQCNRIVLLPWPSFSEFVNLLALKPENYSLFTPPSFWVTSFKAEATAARLTEPEIEFALHCVLQPDLVKGMLSSLKIEVPPRVEEGSQEWFGNIRAELRKRSTTVAELNSALLASLGEVPAESPPPSRDFERPEEGHLERIIGQQSTLLPINFVERALFFSRAVAKVEVLSDGVKSSGSGFVIDGNLLVTNAHVIANAKVAESSNALFNYQKNIAGADLDPIRIRLDPAKFFRNSPVGDYDLTVVALAEESGGRWLELSPREKPVEVDDQVCIIQHPGGDQKHIGMHHNTVTYVDEKLIQYLTDTLPGSSGAPVFDRDWDLVGIHHAGGNLTAPGTKRTLFCNEGIRVQHLLGLIQ